MTSVGRLGVDSEAWREGVALALLLASFCCLAAEDGPDLVIEGNVISGNGIGVYMGWYGEWSVRVVGNRIERNGEGVRIVNPIAFIEGNVIAHNVTGVVVTDDHEEKLVNQVERVVLQGNVFSENERYALQNLARIPLVANDNWWGHPGGPVWDGRPVPSERRVVLWTGWFPAATSVPWRGELVLRTSLTGSGAPLFGLSGFAGSGGPPTRWTWLDSLRWGLLVSPVTLVFVSEVPAASPRANVVAGLLEVQSWLSHPPAGQEDHGGQ